MSRRKHAIEAYFQNGARLHAAGRLHEAEQIYRQVLATAPTHADSLHMLGVLALDTGHPQVALDLIERAIALRPTAAAYHASRGHALSDTGRAPEAVADYQKALRLKPDLIDAHNGLGLALRLAGRLEDAADALQQAVRRAPQDSHARGNLGGVLKELGRLDDAEAQYRAALSRHPQDAVLHFNLAVVLLLKGDFTAGWEEYRWRFKAGAARIPACSQPEWNGEPLGAHRLLVRAEQGMGDTIQFCRYLPLVAKRGAVTLEVQPGLQQLLAPLGVPVIAVGEAPPPFDFYCPLLSLPRIFGMTAPAPPYLTAQSDRVARWRERIGTHGRRIGIAWQGNPTAAVERGRSMPLREFLPLAHVPGVRLISLQKHHGLEQLAQAGVPVETLGEDFDPGPDAFIDAAAVMQCLDLVITSDTAIAHLAGALARPVWVALKHVPDWRWILDRSDSPWYPTMRLFRQKTRDDWRGVFDDMARELAA